MHTKNKIKSKKQNKTHTNEKKKKKELWIYRDELVHALFGQNENVLTCLSLRGRCMHNWVSLFFSSSSSFFPVKWIKLHLTESQRWDCNILHDIQWVDRFGVPVPVCLCAYSYSSGSLLIMVFYSTAANTNTRQQQNRCFSSKILTRIRCDATNENKIKSNSHFAQHFGRYYYYYYLLRQSQCCSFCFSPVLLLLQDY